MQPSETPTVEVWAPGRVNLIGDHTDYTGGLACPMALDVGITIRSVLTDGSWRLANADLGELDVVGRPADVTTAEPSWASYVFAVAAEMGTDAGLRGEITTTLPPGSGLSSSAALEVATALSLGAAPRSVTTAQVCQRAEMAASGVPCGLMDQLASLMGVAGHALRLDCTTFDATPVPLPDSARIVIVHSELERQLAGSAYAERAAQCAAATDAIGPLRHASLTDVDTLGEPTVRRRARHVVTENARVEEFVACLAGGDVRGAGSAMVESHRSLRDDFDVSTPELDDLVDSLVKLPGVHGARLTGAGFGGCVVALCDPDVDPRPPRHRGWIVTASDGAHRIELADDAAG